MKRIFISFLVIISYASAKSQSADDSVKAVVNKMFAAMKSSDGASLISCFGDSAVLQTISRNKQGDVIVLNESVTNFAKSISSAPKGALDERITFDMVKIDANLASVWTPYSFYYNGNFSHCGVNSFQLIRTAGGWKIQYIIDTRRKKGCL